jgi:hypothetical protein
MHPVSQTQPELVFKSPTPCQGTWLYSTFRSSIPWTFWELPNLIPCGRLRRMTFKSFGKTASTVSTERDKLEDTSRHHVTHKSNSGYQCGEQTCETFRNVSIEKMREERNGNGVRKLGSRILRMQYVRGGRGSLVRDVSSVTAVLSFH